jgi:hypothetical protein
MTNVRKLKKRSSLGQPPAEASNNLSAPEVAPVAPPAAAKAPEPAIQQMAHIDGRSLRTRRTSRTIQFSTKITPEFDVRIRQIAHRDGLLLTELLEVALDAYERTRVPT